MLRRLESEDARSSTEGRRKIRQYRETCLVSRDFTDEARCNTHKSQPREGPGQLKLETDAAALGEQGVPAAIVT